jgi:hypothetical protein
VAILVTRLIVRPLLDFWLRPTTDSSGGLFHLAASEKIVASAPARRRAGWFWKPGSLALTNRRLWFFPAEFHEEPWYLPLEDITSMIPEQPLIAELSPIRNWPDQVRVSGPVGPDAVFAVADPEVVLDWLKLVGRHHGGALLAASAGQGAGVFDE